MVALGEGVMVVVGWVVVGLEVEALVEVVMPADRLLPPVVLEVIEVMVASRVVMGWLVELVEARAVVMEAADVVAGWVAVVASEEEELVVKDVVVAAEVVMVVVGLVVVMALAMVGMAVAVAVVWEAALEAALEVAVWDVAGMVVAA